MAVTMHDVAQRAGVSVKTVSNVLNQYPYIRPATKERVERAIAELGYQVNLTARSLRQGRSGIIGLALPELSLPYFAELADSVIRAAEARGVVVVIEQTGADRDRELDALTGQRRQLTDGLLYSPLALGPEDAQALRVDYPLVLLGERIFDGPVDHVTMNNIDGARAAVAHLVSIGRRRIAVIGAHPGEAMGSAALRLEGYRAALTQAGIPYDPTLVGPAGAWHRSTGAEAMTALLESGTSIDGVFAMNDALALGALRVLHSWRVDVPKEIAVIGFDDIDEARYSEPPLTSVSPGREQIARTAVDMLLDRIEERRHDADPRPLRQVVAGFEIVVRESTAG